MEFRGTDVLIYVCCDHAHFMFKNSDGKQRHLKLTEKMVHKLTSEIEWTLKYVLETPSVTDLCFCAFRIDLDTCLTQIEYRHLAYFYNHRQLILDKLSSFKCL